jgi:hypothetical protein
MNYHISGMAKCSVCGREEEIKPEDGTTVCTNILKKGN